MSIVRSSLKQQDRLATLLRQKTGHGGAGCTAADDHRIRVTGKLRETHAFSTSLPSSPMPRKACGRLVTAWGHQRARRSGRSAYETSLSTTLFLPSVSTSLRSTIRLWNPAPGHPLERNDRVSQGIQGPLSPDGPGPRSLRFHASFGCLFLHLGFIPSTLGRAATVRMLAPFQPHMPVTLTAGPPSNPPRKLSGRYRRRR